MTALLLDGSSLTLDAVAAVARQGRKTELSAKGRQQVADCHALLQKMIADGTPIYGVTTGFGALDGRPVPKESNRAQQHNLLKSHAAGIGAPMADDETRAMMLIRANVLATGLTGVSPAALDALLAMLNGGLVPHVPRRGSVGACGDLAPLAHMVLPMIGFGRAKLPGKDWQAGAVAFAALGIAQPAVDGRDGIALINGTEQTTGIGVLAAYDARRLVRLAEAVSAMSLEVLGGVSDAFDERVALAKPHPGQIATSEALRHYTAGSKAVLPPRPSRLRDGLSLRCIPQVLGATRDAVEHTERTLAIEINATNDNPIFGLADGFVTSNSGNFHGQRAGEVLDMLATSVSSLAIISERRAARLVDEKNSGGLPAFLIHSQARQGENSGFMIAQYTAASLVAELRMRSVPATIQSVPTCANTEDHVPMSPLAAERAAFAVDTAATIVAIEALLAAQAYDLRGLTPAPALRPLYEAIRTHVPAMVEDREMGNDIIAVRAALTEVILPA
ncbi:histidine ammonia-lyase [Ferrovibrio terrae]|uniref:Histidine ammonia-lyase n=1 Tax=Ferrovibrio terrae TaxID=2594003 RepID=A0A516GXN8_9PROT|nr:aromatic amino acid lyase [Ferrovibrio terrae]QDO96291.1 histidine ammonia-lyase [Ferrovibrio terrae]